MENHTCSGCGSVYEITKYYSPVRDKDSIECQVCRKEIIRWNGGLYYTSRLLKEGKARPEEK